MVQEGWRGKKNAFASFPVVPAKTRTMSIASNRSTAGVCGALGSSPQMGRDDETREKDCANAETTRGAHACRHTAVAGVALCLALAAAVAFAGRRGGIASRPAAALGERYVNECNLFGCRTVHAQLPPRRLAAVPGIQQELSGRRPLGSSALV
ncbi:MAG: hypothetical protein ACPIOQ_64185, partial [Promethearchaeia archaeon]